MASVEELYKAFGTIADAKDNAGEHSSSFRLFLSAATAGVNEKRLASQFICRFFKHFPDIQDEAINVMFTLCEDADPNIRKQAVKDIPSLCRACPDKVARFADALSMLLATDNTQEVTAIQASLYALFSVNVKAALEGIFRRLHASEDDELHSEEVMGIIRERLLKFLGVKLKQHGDLPTGVEDFIMDQCKQLLEDVTKDEFIAVMDLLRSLKTMSSVQSRQQLVEMVVDQAALDEAFDASDPDCVDRLLHCIKSASPMFSKNVHSHQFVGYMCDSVLPALKNMKDEEGEGNVTLEVLKVLAEVAEFSGEMKEMDGRVIKVYNALLEYTPLPPKEVLESGEEPQLHYSHVECLLYTFHLLARKWPQVLTGEDQADRLKEFRIRLQYIARGSQVCVKRLKEALMGQVGEQLRTVENKKRIVALKLFTNITQLVRDLMHSPPQYKVTVSLSWRPSKDIKPSEAAPTVTSPTGAKRAFTPITYEGGVFEAGVKKVTNPTSNPTSNPKQARSLYQPPGGKFSEKAGTYSDNSGNTTSYRGNRGGYRGRGRGGRGRGGVKQGADTGYYHNKL